jgi:hypothetical protein
LAVLKLAPWMLLSEQECRHRWQGKIFALLVKWVKLPHFKALQVLQAQALSSIHPQ